MSATARAVLLMNCVMMTGHDAHAEHKDRAGTRAEQRLEHLKHERGNAAFGVGQRPGQRQREGEDKNDGPGHAFVHHGRATEAEPFL